MSTTIELRADALAAALESTCHFAAQKSDAPILSYIRLTMTQTSVAEEGPRKVASLHLVATDRHQLGEVTIWAGEGAGGDILWDGDADTVLIHASAAKEFARAYKALARARRYDTSLRARILATRHVVTLEVFNDAATLHASTAQADMAEVGEFPSVDRLFNVKPDDVASVAINPELIASVGKAAKTWEAWAAGIKKPTGHLKLQFGGQGNPILATLNYSEDMGFRALVMPCREV